MEILIRPAALSDYPAAEKIMMQVQEMHVALRPDIYRPVLVALPPEEMQEAIARDAFFVAETENRVVGILLIAYRTVHSPHQRERSVIFVEAMAVDEPYRRMGVGRRFFSFLQTLRDEMHLDGIELQVNARNAGALAMYETCGFTMKSINMELLDENTGKI